MYLTISLRHCRRTLYAYTNWCGSLLNKLIFPTTHINMYNKNCMHPFVNCMYRKFPRRWLVDSPHKPVTRNMLLFDDVIMYIHQVSFSGIGSIAGLWRIWVRRPVPNYNKTQQNVNRVYISLRSTASVRSVRSLDAFICYRFCSLWSIDSMACNILITVKYLM